MLVCISLDYWIIDPGSSVMVAHRAGGPVAGVRFPAPRHFDKLNVYDLRLERCPEVSKDSTRFLS